MGAPPDFADGNPVAPGRTAVPLLDGFSSLTTNATAPVKSAAAARNRRREIRPSLAISPPTASSVVCTPYTSGRFLDEALSRIARRIVKHQEVQAGKQSRRLKCAGFPSRAATKLGSSGWARV